MSIESLIQEMKSDDFEVRINAVNSLADLGDGRAVEPLIHCLRDKDDLIKSAAADALGKIGDKRAVEPLITVLKGINVNRLNELSVGVPQSIVLALANLKDAKASEPLISLHHRLAITGDPFYLSFHIVGALHTLGYTITSSGWRKERK